MSIRQFWLTLFAALVIAAQTSAAETSILEITRLANVTVSTDEQGGWGFSSLINVTRFYSDGRFDALAAGVGFGLSWKNKKARFPIELGLYFAPQFTKTSEDSESEGTVGVIVHSLFFKALGIGVGYDAWSSQGGFDIEGLDTGDRIFFTLGYGLTNETKPASETDSSGS